MNIKFNTFDLFG